MSARAQGPGDASAAAGALRRVGETGWLVHLSSPERVWAFAERVKVARSPRLRDAVPGARSVLVSFRAEPDEDDRRQLADLAAALEATAMDPSSRGPGTTAAPPADASGAARTHEVPVVYDGPDLDAVARHAGMAASEVAQLHAATVYRVAFLGFQPGFAYLVGLPARLRVPRRPSPRPRVPRGSVAIGGEWTGIYAVESPGGWNLIARTELPLFDPIWSAPARFAPGDAVRLVPR